jgi:hypothetical protein
MTATPEPTSRSVRYDWIAGLVHRATELHLGDSQVRTIASHTEQKLRDLMGVAKDTALANGREMVFMHDLPLTKALRRGLVADERFAHEPPGSAIEAYLSDMGIVGQVDPKLGARLPGLFVSLLLLEGRVIAAIEPSNISASERLEYLARTDPHRPTEAEIRRAVQVVDLTL